MTKKFSYFFLSITLLLCLFQTCFGQENEAPYLGDIKGTCTLTFNFEPTHWNLHAICNFSNPKLLTATVEYVTLEIIDVVYLGGGREILNYTNNHYLNEEIHNNTTFDIQMRLELGKHKYPLAIDLYLKFYIKEFDDYLLFSFSEQFPIEYNLTGQKEVTITMNLDGSAEFSIIQRFTNNGDEDLKIFFYFAHNERTPPIGEITAEDMNSNPLEVDGKIQETGWEQQNDFVQIGIEPYYVTVRSGKTYWAKLEYTIPDLADFSQGNFEIKNYFSFRGNLGKIELRIPLTDFFYESIRKLELDLLTPDPESDSIDGNFKSIIWKTPSYESNERLTYEVTVRYHYEYNFLSYLAWIFSAIFVSIAVKIAYDRWIKKFIVKNKR